MRNAGSTRGSSNGPEVHRKGKNVRSLQGSHKGTLDVRGEGNRISGSARGFQQAVN